MTKVLLSALAALLATGLSIPAQAWTWWEQYGQFCDYRKPDGAEKAFELAYQKATGFTLEEVNVGFFGYIHNVGDPQAGQGRSLTRDDILELEKLALANDGVFSPGEMRLLLRDYEDLRVITVCTPVGRYRCRTTRVEVATPESDQALEELKQRYGFEQLPPAPDLNGVESIIKDRLRSEYTLRANEAVARGEYEVIPEPEYGTCIGDINIVRGEVPTGWISHHLLHDTDGTILFLEDRSMEWRRMRFTMAQIAEAIDWLPIED